jgi:hypothetical protein
LTRYENKKKKITPCILRRRGWVREGKPGQGEQIENGKKNMLTYCNLIMGKRNKGPKAPKSKKKMA